MIHWKRLEDFMTEKFALNESNQEGLSEISPTTRAREDKEGTIKAFDGTRN